MYHIAIVEDEEEFSVQLQEYLKRYQEENEIEFKISVFHDGAEILKDYVPCYDAVFMDIEMPVVNGMEAAEQIREKDEDVVIMFITNMAQYALFGYSVGALDFVMKPLNYYTFSMKVRRVLKRVKKKEQEQKTVVISYGGGVKKLDSKQIYFIEVQNHMLHYHTTDGEFVVRGSMQGIVQTLPADTFVKCNHWYLVNLIHVKEVKQNIVVVGEYELEISRRNKTAFMKALTEYLGGSV